MEKKNLWNDAAKYGAIIALVSIAFNVAGMYVKNGFLSFTALVVFVLLLYYFTKRRVVLYGGGENGYSYGQCLLFIFCMMIFSGILEGAYQIVASNWLFTAKYDEMMNQSLAMLSNMGIYNDEQLQLVVSMSKSWLKSPVYLIFSGVLGSIIKGVFFGLFVSAVTKRNPDVFAGSNE